MSTRYLFTFAAKGLQSYIMRGGKLRDMVGATSLVDKLSDAGRLTDLLKDTFGIDPKNFEILQAAAGGARIQFSNKTDASNVARLWPLWCHAWAPDLDVVQHSEEWPEGTSYGTVSRIAGQMLERNRNFPAPRMPEPGPFAKRAPRTGEAAVRSKTTWDGNHHYDLAGGDEYIDLSSRRKRQERLKLVNGLPPVAEAFGFTKPDELPDDFEQVSGGEGAYLAVIHADGNLLGQMFLEVGQAMEKPEGRALEDKNAIALFQFLSEDVVASGTRAAVLTAMAAVNEAIDKTVARQMDEEKKRPNPDGRYRPEAWPFAPLVLAGDDVTVVCRADLGLPFASAFLKAFRAEMKKRLGWLKGDEFPDDPEQCKHGAKCKGLWGNRPDNLQDAIPDELTAGAGVVFCTDHYPFSLAYELCESVSKHAKDVAKKAAGDGNTPSSALSFVRITGGSTPTEFAELTDGILKGADGTLLTGGPYYVDGTAKPQFADLMAVSEAARPTRDPAKDDDKRKRGLPGTSLRTLLNLQRTNIRLVSDAVSRMREVAGGLESDTLRRADWDGFARGWAALCGNEPLETLRFPRDVRHFVRKDGSGREVEHDCSPLLDLLTVLAVRDKDDNAEQGHADAGDSPRTEK